MQTGSGEASVVLVYMLSMRNTLAMIMTLAVFDIVVDRLERGDAKGAFDAFKNAENDRVFQGMDALCFPMKGLRAMLEHCSTPEWDPQKPLRNAAVTSIKSLRDDAHGRWMSAVAYGEAERVLGHYHGVMKGCDDAMNLIIKNAP